MAFPGTYRELGELLRREAFHTVVARGIVRKAGFRAGGQGGGNGVSVLTCAAADGERTLGEQSGITVPSHYQWDDIPPGVQNYFTWTPMQTTFPWFPDGYEFGFHTTVCDFSNCSQIKNSWVVAVGYANPDLNIRVMASLDGTTWSYPTTSIDWLFDGANVNCAGWYTYTIDGDPYQNYPPEYAVHAAADNAFPGGWTSSEWHDLLPEFRVDGVYLRWTADWSHDYSDDPIYTQEDFVALGFGEIRAR